MSIYDVIHYFPWSSLKVSFVHLSFVIADHLFEAHADVPAGLPLQRLLGAGGIGATLLGVIGRDGLVDDVDTASAFDAFFVLNLLHDVANKFSELADGEFITVSDVDRAAFVRVHEGDHAIDEVVNVLERTSLRSITVDGHVFAFKGLDDEVRDHTSIEGVH